MTTSPRLGITDLAEGQASPEADVNENVRILEQAGNAFIAKDKDILTPPGSPADGDCYVIAGTGTGGWSGKDQKIAVYIGSSWHYITPIEGTRAYLQDEDKWYSYSGSAWSDVGASTSAIWTGTATDKYLTPKGLFDSAAPVALTSSASITPDFNAGLNFSVTLAHSGQLNNPSNAKVGQSGVIEITQDGTGSRTWTFGSNWKFPSGAPVLSTAPGAIDLLTFMVTASGRILGNLTKAYTA